MQKTNIEYLDYTWNPLAMKCTPVSEGCANCWHLGFANRHAHNPKFSKECRMAYAGGEPYLKEDELLAPYKLKKPARIGVQFMGDIFHESVCFDSISRILIAINNNPQHMFLILTKRPERAKEYFSKDYHVCCGRYMMQPLPANVQFGVSCENQQMADQRIPFLLQIPATIRFVSIEPMLGAVDLTSTFVQFRCCECGHEQIGRVDGFTGQHVARICPNCKLEGMGNNHFSPAVDFVVVGGESGSKARPIHPNWVRSVCNQCIDANIPFFFKQWGEWAPKFFTNKIHYNKIVIFDDLYNSPVYLKELTPTMRDRICFRGTPMYKVGKKIAGNLLDGKVWNQVPGETP